MSKPTEYTPELGATVCLLIAEGFSLRHIEKIEGMPGKSTVMKWCLNHDEFQKQYARAKEQQADAFAEEILEIADDASNDWMERLSEENKKIGWMLNGDHVQRSRLRIDSRKWLMGKMRPKKYGDSNTIKLADPDGNAFTLDGILAAIDGKTAGLPKKTTE
jgi:hypothetical protein